jgi:8-oxo-dGTP pyrophosphatase MutT (NUDIX family)
MTLEGNAAIRRLLKLLIAQLRIYRLAALVYEAWRRLARPHTHGALVAVWHGQELLLLETSYRRSWGLPGGGIQRDETPRQAAVRELGEEVGLLVRDEELLDPWQICESSSGGLNTVTIFTLPLPKRPELNLDGLEIVAGHWLSREQALAQELPDHVHIYLKSIVNTVEDGASHREDLG